MPGLIGRIVAAPILFDAYGRIGAEPEPLPMPPFVLPGNNYHVFDYALFWANLRADAERRLAEFAKR